MGVQRLMGERVIEFGNSTAFEGAVNFGSTHPQTFGKIAIPPLAILPQVSFEEDRDILRFEHGG